MRLIATRLAAKTRAKWAIFRAAEHGSRLLARIRGLPAAKSALELSSPRLPDVGEGRALWIFLSTIGELNAVNTFLYELLARYPRRPIVFLTDHAQYGEPFRARFPRVHVAVMNGCSEQFRELASVFPPALLVIAEIPCRPSDGPCNFPFAALYVAKSCGARVVLVNGWLYGIGPDCGLDRLELRLFDGDWRRLVDLFLVQEEAGCRQLLELGVEPERVAVTGNIKFDGVRALLEESQAVQEAFAETRLRIGPRPCVVVGSVQAHWEIERTVDAFAGLRARVPDAFLVFALRYPNMPGRLDYLVDLLEKRALTYVRRSADDGTSTWSDIDVLLLDTIGELRYFYSLADLSYLGVNHNPLEPLAFGRPVFVSAGWTETYPSWPVYRQLLAAGALKQFGDTAALTEACSQTLAFNAASDRETELRALRTALEKQEGATARTLEIWERRLGWELG